ncbi:MAG: hypothetical protein O2779_03325 [Nanoarchaeota archaeon]|nr:hypothetical protein [Nanoarchaeota archaeon]
MLKSLVVLLQTLDSGSVPAQKPVAPASPQPAVVPLSGKKFGFGSFLKILLLLLIVGGAWYLFMNPGGIQAVVNTFFGKFGAQ